MLYADMATYQGDSSLRKPMKDKAKKGQGRARRAREKERKEGEENEH